MKARLLNIRPINDRDTANAFIFGLICNQNQKAERAWNAPYVLKDRLGTLDPADLLKLDYSTLQTAVIQKPALHPFVVRTTEHIRRACQLLVEAYDGDARVVWEGGKTVSQVLNELQRFAGIGRHKATVGVFLLRHHLGVDIRDDGTRLNIKATCPNLYDIYGGDE